MRDGRKPAQIGVVDFYRNLSAPEMFVSNSTSTQNMIGGGCQPSADEPLGTVSTSNLRHVIMSSCAARSKRHAENHVPEPGKSIANLTNNMVKICLQLL